MKLDQHALLCRPCCIFKLLPDLETCVMVPGGIDFLSCSAHIAGSLYQRSAVYPLDLETFLICKTICNSLWIPSMLQPDYNSTCFFKQ